MAFPQYDLGAVIVFTSSARAHPKVRSDPDENLVRDTIAFLQCQALWSAPGQDLCRAWETFYARYDPLVRRVVHACRVARADLDDCVQEVWVEILRKLPSFHCNPPRGRFGSWLTTLVARKAARTAQRIHAHAVADLGESSQCLVCHEADPADHYEQSRQARLVHEALDRLQHEASATTCAVVHLRWIEGETVAEASRRLGLTSEQVYQRTCRALEKLREMLTGGNEDLERQFGCPDPAEKETWV